MPAFLGKRLSAFLDSLEGSTSISRLNVTIKRTGSRRILIEDDEASSGILDLARMNDGLWVPVAFAPARGDALHTVLDIDTDFVPRRFRRRAQYDSVAFAKEFLADIRQEFLW